MWVSVVTLGVTAVIYTSIGGFKAVVWTDVCQSVIMLAGVMVVLIKVTIDVGGPARVWNIGEQGGRMNFFNFDLDPRTRHTFWNLIIGNSFRAVGLLFNQNTIQRIGSVRSFREARQVMILFGVGFTVLQVVFCYQGLTVYAYYTDLGCDPIASKAIKNPNQIVPYAVLEMFQQLPGLPGIFLAALFSASLSTLSSNLNALSAMSMTAIIRPLLGEISDRKATRIAKYSTIVFGSVAVGLAFMVASLGGTLAVLFTSISSAFNGPSSGLYLLGCFCPKANAKGAFLGSLISFVFVAWITFGMNFSPAITRQPFLPPAPTDRCDLADSILENNTFPSVDNFYRNTSGFNNVLEEHTHPEPTGIEHMYTLSYNWVAAIGLVGTLVLGMVFSALTGFNKPGDVNPSCLVSVSDTVLFFLPGKIRHRVSSLGPQFMEDKLGKYGSPPEVVVEGDTSHVLHSQNNNIKSESSTM